MRPISNSWGDEYVAVMIPELTVFFPCYNEEDNVESLTLRVLEVCRPLTDDLEVLIVNDGSKDRTKDIADRLAAEHPEVRAVHNQPNRGYGGALQRGFREATKAWIFYTDGDGQFDIGEITAVLPLRGPETIVSAYRMDRKDPMMRKVNAWCWGRLVRTVFRLPIRDIDCAFKLFPAKLFSQIEMCSNGALIDTEILARATRLGYRIVQLGVHHYPRTAGEQTGANLRVIAKAFGELFKLRRRIIQAPGRADPA